MPSVKFLRIHPKTWQEYLALRFELLGCEDMGEIKYHHTFKLSANEIYSLQKMIIYFPSTNIQDVVLRGMLVTEPSKVHAPTAGFATMMGHAGVIDYELS